MEITFTADEEATLNQMATRAGADRGWLKNEVLRLLAGDARARAAGMAAMLRPIRKSTAKMTKTGRFTAS